MPVVTLESEIKFILFYEDFFQDDEIGEAAFPLARIYSPKSNEAFKIPLSYEGTKCADIKIRAQFITNEKLPRNISTVEMAASLA